MPRRLPCTQPEPTAARPETPPPLHRGRPGSPVPGTAEIPAPSAPGTLCTHSPGAGTQRPPPRMPTPLPHPRPPLPAAIRPRPRSPPALARGRLCLFLLPTSPELTRVSPAPRGLPGLPVLREGGREGKGVSCLGCRRRRCWRQIGDIKGPGQGPAVASVVRTLRPWGGGAAGRAERRRDRRRQRGARRGQPQCVDYRLLHYAGATVPLKGVCTRPAGLDCSAAIPYEEGTTRGKVAPSDRSGCRALGNLGRHWENLP
ncbi:kit ligand isoform X2 [Malurus melanocephalus]|uniref:kit ligand isoform X2 n=1 Tax=Malurus melanocephalus TaxID=175006 RepID=UPI002546AA3A|nr:kit ligand isoform X2 [Malurus melanocephalus]